jgi:hypothetical protein
MSIDDATPQEWDWVAGKLKAVEDPVDKPDHYNKGSIEAIEAIKASMPEHEFKGYLKGNALKYLWRYDYKGKPVEDLRKCRWYIERLIKEINE